MLLKPRMKALWLRAMCKASIVKSSFWRYAFVSNCEHYELNLVHTFSDSNFGVGINVSGVSMYIGGMLLAVVLNRIIDVILSSVSKFRNCW